MAISLNIYVQRTPWKFGHRRKLLKNGKTRRIWAVRVRIVVVNHGVVTSLVEAAKTHPTVLPSAIDEDF